VTYTDYNDRRDRDNRIAVETWNAERARMLAATEEYELGAITLFMSKRDLQARLRESAYVGADARRPAAGGEIADPDPRDDIYDREVGSR
jgi:hypothetical protein